MLSRLSHFEQRQTDGYDPEKLQTNEFQLEVSLQSNQLKKY